MINLDKSRLVGKGLHREVYTHPENNNLCIKVVVHGNADESRREKEYYRLLEKRRIVWGMIPRYHGDVETNLEPMFKTPHDTFHAEMRAQGSNQFPGENLEISKTKLTQRLRKVKTKKDLDALWDEMLADDVQYLYKTASIWQPMDKLIKEISPKFTGKAPSKPK